jgi:hypothetical protein
MDGVRVLISAGPGKLAGHADRAIRVRQYWHLCSSELTENEQEFLCVRWGPPSSPPERPAPCCGRRRAAAYEGRLPLATFDAKFSNHVIKSAHSIDRCPLKNLMEKS